MPLWFLAIPLAVRVAIVFAIGLGLGALVNLGIYTLAWDARGISPWSRRPANGPPRKWSDYLPVIGWIGLARERELWGRGFWLRPVLLELFVAGGLAALYYLEVTNQLIPVPPWILPPGAPSLDDITHARFFSHGLLILLMVVATFIDFDEKTIPDWITVPGALVGLAFAALWPFSLPTSPVKGLPPLPDAFDWLWLTAPNPWSPRLDRIEGLLFGLVCFWGWCFAILERRWLSRRGWRFAAQLFFARIVRSANTLPTLVIAALGTIAIVVTWSYGGVAWKGLLTSLAGLAFGGGLVWAIRVIGTHSLGQEAMGFGDVTLMAMIGAFVGWQGALVAFFIAPFTALGIAIAQWIFTRRHDLAFGPYLCAGALIVLLRWPEIWEAVRAHFLLGWLIPAITAFCLMLMWIMLAGWRAIKERYFYAEEES